MATTHVDAIERSVQKTNEWLKELARELGTDERTTWRVLHAYLQVLRDRLTIDEAAQLAAQVPVLLRGVATRASIQAIGHPSAAPANRPLRDR